MIRRSIKPVIVAALLAWPAAALAGVTTYGDQSSFAAAVNTTHYDFAAYDGVGYAYVPSLTAGPASFTGSVGDVLFLMSPSFVYGYPSTILSSQFGDVGLNIDLAGGATAFGLSFASYYSYGGTTDVLVNGNYVTTLDIPNAYSSTAFIGFVSLDGITSIQFNSHGTSATFDAVSFDTDGVVSEVSPSPTPEPASWAMMLVGFGAVGIFLRRRRALSAVVSVC